MPIKEIKKVCFAGAGTMGCFNSMVSAIAGYEVSLYDVSEEALENSEERQRLWGEALIGLEFTTAASVEEALTRVTRTTDAADAAADADLLSESVFEQVDLKRETHAAFEKLLPPHAIMTTNTSSILLSDIEDAVENGARFAAMHFHQPGRLVDLLAGPRTSPETMDILKRFVLSQNQVAVVLKKEKAGYIHNTLFGALLNTAMALEHTTEATHQEIDRAWILNQRAYRLEETELELGPFGILDYVGLNVAHDAIAGAIKKADDDGTVHEQKKMIMAGIRDNLKAFLDRGEMGMKTGKGFYTYPEPEYQEPVFLEGVTENKELSDPIINAILKQAVLLVADGICEVEDVDLSWMMTHRLSIGPFGLMDTRGLDVLSGQLKEQAAFLEAIFGKADPDIDESKRATDFLDDMTRKGHAGKAAGRGFYVYPDPAYAKEGFIP